jgi:hypothetical protein
VPPALTRTKGTAHGSSYQRLYHIPIPLSYLADPALADALGHADAVLKGAEAECKLLKDRAV